MTSPRTRYRRAPAEGRLDDLFSGPLHWAERADSRLTRAQRLFIAAGTIVALTAGTVVLLAG